MNKYAAEKIAQEYYALGVQYALQNAGLIKTADETESDAEYERIKRRIEDKKLEDSAYDLGVASVMGDKNYIPYARAFTRSEYAPHMLKRKYNMPLDEAYDLDLRASIAGSENKGRVMEYMYPGAAEALRRQERKERLFKEQDRLSDIAYDKGWSSANPGVNFVPYSRDTMRTVPRVELMKEKYKMPAYLAQQREIAGSKAGFKAMDDRLPEALRAVRAGMTNP